MNELTKDQKIGISKLIPFLASPDDNYFILKGGPGVGKSYMLAAKELQSHMPEYVLTAPTHKAVEQLRKRAPQAECLTIHKFLGLAVRKKEGETYLIRNNRADVSKYAQVRLVILDEISMVNDQLLKYIQQDIEMWGRSYLMVGDEYQLPPPKSKNLESPAFRMVDSKHTHVLSKIVRQAEDNPLILVAEQIRKAIKLGEEPTVRTFLKGDIGVECLNRAMFYDKLRSRVREPEFIKDPDFCKILSWTNETGRYYNRFCRQVLGKDPSLPFDVGDLVVVNEAYSVEGEVIFNTGAELRINSIMELTHPTYDELDCWGITVSDISTKESLDGSYLVIKDSSTLAYRNTLNKLRKEAIQSGYWSAFEQLKEGLLDVRSGYSLTTHKAQGSTFKYTFVDFRDIYKNKRKSEADRCFYTALTRASHKATVLY